MERKFSFMSAACLQENWVNLCTGKDLQGGVKNRRNQSFIFYVRRGERKEKKSFLLLNLFRSSPPFYQKLQIHGGGYKKLFFPPFPCYRYREVRLVSELWPPKGVSSQLDFYQRKKKMVKFYIAELYNLFPSFELAWLLSFSWEWGYKFWRKKTPLKSDMQLETESKIRNDRFCSLVYLFSSFICARFWVEERFLR